MTAAVSWTHGLCLFVLLDMAMSLISVSRGNISGHAGFMTDVIIGADVIGLLGCG